MIAIQRKIIKKYSEDPGYQRETAKVLGKSKDELTPNDVASRWIKENSEEFRNNSKKRQQLFEEARLTPDEIKNCLRPN